MSTKYTGGFITKSPVAPTSSAASGIWTLDQQQQAQKAGTWPSPPIFIEDMFSTYLYTGNGSTQTITNGINLSANDGLVWIKCRSAGGATRNNRLWTTNLGGSGVLQSDSAAALYDYGSTQVTYNSNGFGLSSDAGINANGDTYVSWTFKEQPKFFDIVTWSGDDASKVLSHNLGSVPGCIVVKSLVGTGNWQTWHRSLTAGNYIRLNTTAAQSSAGAATVFGNNSTTVDPTSTQFTVGSNICAAGENYVAYLFAHDAGGFPVSGGGSTNGISCGSFTTDGSGNFSVNLGYEPQWILAKQSTGSANNWAIFDNMRGMSNTNVARLIPNSTAAESDFTSPYFVPTATGFFSNSGGFFDASQTVIYIAIRRGPMKTPTVGTSVFIPTSTATAGSGGAVATTNFPVDLSIYALRDHGGYPAVNSTLFDRLRGTRSTSSRSLISSSTASEDISATNGIGLQSNTTVTENWTGSTGYTNVLWNFRRAPGFFDEVCYAGNSTAGTTITHNLGVVPEFIIVKSRNIAANWRCYVAPLGNVNIVDLDSTGASASSPTTWNSTTPTASVFTVGTNSSVNNSAYTYVAYLFATCPDVSKVGSYTGNGTTQAIACGFTGGARFVLIKRTDSSGSWYVYDTARGMTVLTDPYLLMNSTAAEVATLGSVITSTGGFTVNAAILAAINTNGASYIFLAIA